MNTIYADFDNIVFEGREKTYGAYELRKKQNEYLARALMMAGLLFLSVTAVPKMISWMYPKGSEAAFVPPVTTDDNVLVEVVLLDEKEEKPPEIIPPAPKVAPPLPPVTTREWLRPKPVKDEDVAADEKLLASNADLKDANPDFIDHDATDDNYEDYPWDDMEDYDKKRKEVLEVKENHIIPPDTFTLLEREPQPVNMGEVSKLIGYPKLAKENEIEGRVTIRMYIDDRGNYVTHKVLNKSTPPILVKAVEAHLNKLKFTPGIQGTQAIPVWITVPFSFVLTR